ncbi:betaine-aldehyde dehydrogenase [Stylonychia lemnae]|uniref:Betaine-aldehyde dehydrogenase n=1 Tax=Stylonychia lemnae TaxID=5949 RepID=A0A078ASU3_STYLE|nr:betaine-aldehyde dehydrogenase [Stylonychia lemnae]|eukprot:CDW85535.1 betaine-aldehyde dehydrogenase [Stylonychia lemnae]
MLTTLLKRSFTSSTHIKPRVTQLLINGKFVNSASGQTFDTFNPATEEKIASVQEAGAEDVDRAVKAARKAFDEGPWRRMAASERGKLLCKLADLIDKNVEELGYLEALDNGKPEMIATQGDVPFCAMTLRYYAGWADKIHGKTIPVNGPYFAYTKEEPVGVCGQIIPWNYPTVMAGLKLGPALATGCTLVLKPAEDTPLTALRIGELALEAGFPDGVINILPGLGSTAGQALVQHPLVDKIAFTGSTEVGYSIMRNSHKDNLKRITLELGGKSPNIVMDDADIDQALQLSAIASYFNAGQICISGSRLYENWKSI